MGAVKLSVSLDEEHIRFIKQQAKTRKTTVSALLAEAVEDWRRTRALEHLIEQLGGHVELSPEEITNIREEWQG